MALRNLRSDPFKNTGFEVWATMHLVADHGGTQKLCDLLCRRRTPHVHRQCGLNGQGLGHGVWRLHETVQGAQALCHLHEVL